MTVTSTNVYATVRKGCPHCGPNQTCGHILGVVTITLEATRRAVKTRMPKPPPVSRVPQPFPERRRGQPGRHATPVPQHLLMLNARARR